MPRRAGTLVSRGKNKWLIRIDNGRDTNGKRDRINRTIHGTKKDAERVLNQLLRQRDLGVLTDASKQSLDEYLDHWLEVAARTRLRAATNQEYTAMLERYIRPGLGHLKLQQVTPISIQSVYSTMLARGLSARTVRYTHAVLRNALQQAVKWRMLHTNPADAVNLPKQIKNEAHALTKDEAARFLEHTKRSRYHPFFALLLGTGLRPGEALALRWTDLDLGSDVLRVSRSVRKVGREWVFSEPKTQNARRTIDLPPDLSKVLADVPKHFDLVFPNADGEPASYSSIKRNHFKPALERAGPPDTVRVYDLRHTHATLLLLAGVHPKIVSSRLGHADVSLTLNTYSHVLPGMGRESAEKINAMLFEAPSNGVSKELN